MDQPTTFLSSLFDLSFSEFVTIKLIRALYGIGIFCAAVATLFFIGSAESFGRGVLYFILSPAVFIVLTIVIRVLLEVTIVLFRIAEHVSIIAKVDDKAK
jgi:hypothetical protein